MKNILAQAGRKFPHTIAVLSEKNMISYRELNLWAESLMPAISGRKKNCIVLETRSRVPDIILLWSVWRAGKTAVLLNTRLPKAIAARQIKLINSTRLKNAATVLFTSGTSAAPKAVVHTHDNHYYNALGSQANLPLKINDRWLLSLPLYHVSGLSIVYRCCLTGATIVLPSPDRNLIQNIRDNNVTHVSLVSTQLYRLLQDKKNIPILRRLKAILLGGGPIPPELIKTALRHKLPIYLTYGLTETASQAATSSIRDLKPGELIAVRPLKYRQIKFARDGEILVKGKVLSPGYATKAGIQKITDKDGWFATGDIGQKISVDQFIVLGRKDNMFISGGENIYPEEIERILLGYPAVEQAIVLSEPDKEFGMRPVAMLKIDTRMNRFKLREFLTKHLPGYKIPVKFYRIPDNAGKNEENLKINRSSVSSLWQSEPKKFRQI